MERVILPDCCEDWILAYGAYHAPGAEFECIECGSPWRKLATGSYQSLPAGRVWAERRRTAEDREFRYLESEEGGRPLTERCCARLILEHGRRIRPGRRFTCPICGSAWHKDLVEHRSGLRLEAYIKPDPGIAIAVQRGAGRDFLVPLDEYQPPRPD